MTDPADADPAMAALERQVTALEAACHAAKISALHRYVQLAVAVELLKRAGGRLADLRDGSELLVEIGAFLAQASPEVPG